jgi:hypothetical protein
MERFLNESAIYVESVYAESAVGANDADHLIRDHELVEERLRRNDNGAESTSDGATTSYGEKDLEQLYDLHRNLQRNKEDKKSGSDNSNTGESAGSDELVAIQKAEISILQSINQTWMLTHEKEEHMHVVQGLNSQLATIVAKVTATVAAHKSLERQTNQLREEHDRLIQGYAALRTELEAAKAEVKSKTLATEESKNLYETQRAINERLKLERRELHFALKNKDEKYSKKLRDSQQRCQNLDAERNDAIMEREATRNEFLKAKEQMASDREILAQHLKEATLALEKMGT